MIRLGFWPSSEKMPSGPADEIRRIGELQRELRSLTVENTKLRNVDQIRRDQLKKRLAESKQKRLENKQRKLKEREERAARWKQKKEKEITWLGKGYSAGLSTHGSDLPKLQHLGVRQLSTVDDLARSMGMTVGMLRFLAFGRRTSKTSHYQRFAIRKKTGGVRVISAPMPRLKNAQRWILDSILNHIGLHHAAHGFRPGCSIVTNAMPHVGAHVVINMDLENFFPTVTCRRVKGVFRNIGYGESIATILAMLCSEPEIAEVEIDRERYFVARGERFLPQGAPTSPAITNIICRGLDVRLSRIADQLGFTYTRYADDITFSSREVNADVGRAIRRIKFVVENENFKVHPDKTRVLRKGRRMEVTGLTVNERVSVPRQQLRNFRATLHQIERNGPKGRRWGSSPDVIAAISGYANFVAMVEPDKGRKFQQQVIGIIEKWGRSDPVYFQRPRWVDPMQIKDPGKPVGKESKPGESGKPNKSGDGTDGKAWWKFW